MGSLLKRIDKAPIIVANMTLAAGSMWPSCHDFELLCIFALPSRLLWAMEQMHDPDLAPLVAGQLWEVHSCFEKADEAFRRFRVCILTDPPLPQYIPREWIPISNH
jgi:hypothetical protein